MCVLCVPMSVCCVWVAFVVAVVRVLSCVCTAHVGLSEVNSWYYVISFLFGVSASHTGFKFVLLIL